MIDADATASPEAPRLRVRLPVLLAAAGCIVYVAAARYLVGRFALPLDDGYIHLQFARNLAAGHGMAYEAGRWVAGSTAPLWTALLSLLAWLPGSAVVWAQLVGTLCCVAAVPQVARLAVACGTGRRLAWLAALLAAVTGPLVWAAVSGLEIALFVLLTLVAVRRHLVDRHRRHGVAASLPIFALATLARPEGLLLLALAVADRAIAHRGRPLPWWRSSWPGLAAAAMLLAPVVAFHLVAGDSPLPTTAAAKGAAWYGWTPDLRTLHTIFGILFRSQPWMTWLAAGGVVALLARRGGERSPGALPAAWCVALPVAYAIIGAADPPVVGNFGRYLYPLFPFVVVLGCLAIAPLERRLAAGTASRSAALLLAAMLAAPAVAQWGRLAGRFAQNVANVVDGDVAAAEWLGERLPQGSVVAVNDVGAIGYLLPRHRLVDLAGIVTPELAVYTRAALSSGRREVDGILDLLEQRRPEALVIFPDWYPSLAAMPSRFRPVREFRVRDNITLGGDRLVVYATPWTRARLTP